MKHSESAMIELGKKVLKDIKFEYYHNMPITARFNSKENSSKYPSVQKSWTIFAKWFDHDFLDGMDSIASLMIDDETGIPIVLRLATGGGGNCVIAKDNDGIYFIESNY